MTLAVVNSNGKGGKTRWSRRPLLALTSTGFIRLTLGTGVNSPYSDLYIQSSYFNTLAWRGKILQPDRNFKKLLAMWRSTFLLLSRSIAYFLPTGHKCIKYSVMVTPVINNYRKLQYMLCKDS